MSSSTPTFQSRFGFHPCDRETFLKLKAHKYTGSRSAIFTAGGAGRQAAAQPPRPDGFCDLFVENKPWHRPRGTGQDAVRRYPRTLVDRGVLAWHAAARHPQAEPPPPFDEKTLQEIDRVFTAATNWFARS
jgi:hypothetical protein